MTERQFALDENGFLVPPSFGGAAAPAFEAARAHAEEPAGPARVIPGVARAAAEAAARGTRRSAGRLNWVLSVLGILTGLASFVWPLLCLTVLVSLALTAVALSRANRLRRQGATGRGLAVVGLVIGLASAANLVFGFSQLFELGSFVDQLIP